MDDGVSAADTFFGGLENQLYGSGKVSVRQFFGKPESNRRMAVMGASVHVSFIAGAKCLCLGEVVRVRTFQDRQRIHVKPERDGRPFLLSFFTPITAV